MNRRVQFILCTALGILWAEEPARIQAFKALPAAVRRGSPVTLEWSATGTERVRLDPLGVEFPAKGSISHPLIGRTTFWLHAVNASGGQSLPVVVDVLPDEPPPPRPALLPLPEPAAPPRSGTVWIQFAALSAPASVLRLQGDLRRAAGIETVLSDVPDPLDPRRALQRIRLGPFATDRAAKARLLELKPRLAGLALKPYVDRGGEAAPALRQRRKRHPDPSRNAPLESRGP